MDDVCSGKDEIIDTGLSTLTKPPCAKFTGLSTQSLFTSLPPLPESFLYQFKKPQITEDSLSSLDRLKTRYVTDQIIVKYQRDTRKKDKDQLRLDHGIADTVYTVSNKLSNLQVERIKLSAPQTPEAMEELILTLESDPRIVYAEPNYVADAQMIPNDLDYPSQWNLPAIQAPLAWDTTLGTSTVTIAILDTGLDESNVDKPINILPGFDVLGNDYTPDDQNGHGTFVTGVIAANTNNGSGIAGVCPECSVLPVKVLDEHGLGTYADLAEGIIYAVDRGVNIINLSAGGYAYSQLLADAVEYAHSHGVVVVAAAGNDGASDPLFPASLPDVISVGATDSNDQIWANSNTSEVDIYAPGVDIYSLDINNFFSTRTGTSLSAAHVAGAVGLLLSYRPEATPEQVLAYIVSGANNQQLNIANALTQSGNGVTDSGVNQGTPIPDSVILLNQLNWLYSTESIQNFLNTQPGILKNYTTTTASGQTYTGADILTTMNEGWTFFVNPRVLLVMLELLSHTVTNPTADEATLATAARINHDIYWRDFIRMDGHEFEFPDDPIIRERDFNAQTFFAQVSGLAAELEAAKRCWEGEGGGGVSTCDGLLHFADGSTLTPDPAINAETYAVQSVLAELAQSRAEWDTWVSRADGSFYELYRRWFGDPVKPVMALDYFGMATTSVPFMVRKPYDGLVNLNSYFDHELPTYGVNGEVLPFVSTVRSDDCGIAPRAYGYACYDGHDGIDYNTSSGTIRAVADGFVQSIHSYTVENHEFGNAIFVKHNVDGDNKFDFVVSYNHLATSSPPGQNLFPLNWHVGDTVRAGDVIGYSGGTGQNDDMQYSNHLHFGVRRIIYATGSNTPTSEDPYTYQLLDPYGWWGNDADDPAANRASQSGIFRSTKSTWLWKALQSGGRLVDDEDASFQHLYNSSVGALWREVREPSTSTSTAIGSRALYTYGVASTPGMRRFDNWAFWVPNLPSPGLYRVEAYIPALDAPGSSATTSLANYYIYQKHADGTATRNGPYAIDQSAHGGSWQTLVALQFEAGANAAVQLVDETDVSNAGRVIWADAVRFTVVGSPSPSTSDVQFTGAPRVTQTTLGTTGLYRYNIQATVRNIGSRVIENGRVCLRQVSFLPCLGRGLFADLYNLFLRPNEERGVSFSVTTELPLTGDPVGTLEISDVYPREIGGGVEDNNLFNVPLGEVRTTSTGPDPNNTEFGQIEMIGIERDELSNDLEFALRSREAGGSPVALFGLDISREKFQRYFFQALTIPNSKHWVELGLVRENGSSVGRARFAPPFEQTDLADTLFRGDARMKFNLIGHSLRLDPTTHWTTLVESSPYWSEFSAAGFDLYPDADINAYIRPDRLTARRTADRIVIEEISLALYFDWINEPYLYPAALATVSLSPGALGELEELLDVYRDDLMTNFIEIAENDINYRLNNSADDGNGSYKQLRQAYAVIALAQWYKANRTGTSPYNYLVDTENLSGLAIPFGQAYWDSQADQLFATVNCTTFWGPSTCEYRGGADLAHADPNVLGSLTVFQDTVAETTLDDYNRLWQGEDQYAFGLDVLRSDPELTVTHITPSSGPYVVNQPITVAVDVTNNSPADAALVPLRLVLNTRSGTRHFTSDVAIASIPAWQTVAQSFSLTLPNDPGEYTLIAHANLSGAVVEVNAGNNAAMFGLTVVSPQPVATIYQPEPVGETYLTGDRVTFSGAGIDASGAPLPEANLVWSSSLDGVLGTGKILEVSSLSIGNHAISLTATDSTGLSSAAAVTITIIAPPPSRFLSLTVDKPTVTTDEQDIQTARLVIDSYRPDDITDLRIRVNRSNSATQPTRGFFQWTPTTGFVEYYSNNNYGNNHVTLQLTGPNASERIVDTANHTVTYIFRWTISPTAGSIPDSDISYYWQEPGNNKTVDWTLVQTNFVTEYVPSATGSTFQSLTVDKPLVYTDEVDVQTVRLTIQTSRPDDITTLRLRVNRANTSQNPSRGLFEWTPTTGFTEYYSPTAYGNQHVSLQITGPNASERIINTTNNTITFVFRWTLSPSSGNVADSDISYYWQEPTNNKTIDWTLVNTSFVTEYRLSSVTNAFLSLTVDKPAIVFDGTDLQTARLTLNTPNQSNITAVKLRINRADSPTQPKRGFFTYTPSANLFAEYLPRNYGNPHVNLTPESEVITDTVNHTTTYIFRWTTNSTYTAIPDNDLSFQIEETSGTTIPWQLVQTSFVVGPVPEIFL